MTTDANGEKRKLTGGISAGEDRPLVRSAPAAGAPLRPARGIGAGSAKKPQSGIGKRRSAAKEDSSANYQAKRQEIAEAAVRVFNRLGFERASMQAVADDLGVDRGSLYYYIASKEALFDEVVRTVVERNLALTRQIEASDLSKPAE